MKNRKTSGRAYPTQLETNRFMRTPLSYPEHVDPDAGGAGSLRGFVKIRTLLSAGIGAGAVLIVHTVFWH